MTADPSDLREYFAPLSTSDKNDLERRAETYREQLEAQGYEVAIAESEHGFFAGVLVIDEAADHYGFLEEDGSVTWISGDPTGVGSLGSAVAQNPTEALRQEPDELDEVDIE